VVFQSAGRLGKAARQNIVEDSTPRGRDFRIQNSWRNEKTLCFTAGHKKDIAEGLDGSNDMTSLTALLSKWSLIRQIADCADGSGLEREGVRKM
jgi:hypothetical protein